MLRLPKPEKTKVKVIKCFGVVTNFRCRIFCLLAGESNMKFRHLIVMSAALAAAPAAFAVDEGEALFIKSKCSACHKLDDKKVGPTLKGIAAKYVGNKDAPATLEKKVRSGGVGVWGSMPMPRTPATVTDEEIKMIVVWMLAQ